jgi:hypothetical protein
MDSIQLSWNRSTVDGLCRMMRDMDDAEHYVYAQVDIPAALYIVAIARHAEDRNDYFHYGKWATIQAIEGAIEKELTKLDKKAET